jgi:hypothetical protein
LLVSIPDPIHDCGVHGLEDVFYFHRVVTEFLEIADVAKGIMTEKDDVALFGRVIVTEKVIAVLGSERCVEASRHVVRSFFEWDKGRITEIETVRVSGDEVGID